MTTVMWVPVIRGSVLLLTVYLVLVAAPAGAFTSGPGGGYAGSSGGIAPSPIPKPFPPDEFTLKNPLREAQEVRQVEEKSRQLQRDADKSPFYPPYPSAPAYPPPPPKFK